MPESDQSASYRAYLLRCWVEDPGINGQRSWRFSLESLEESQRRGFASLEALVEYLYAVMKEMPETS